MPYKIYTVEEGIVKKPNFFIIGAPRCGTTSLHYYLSQHPDVYMPAWKEPYTLAFKDGEFINSDPKTYPIQKETYREGPSIKNYSKYLSLFQEAKNESAIGEASPLYICSIFAYENIKTLYPHSKLIVSLRNPADQVLSSYYYAVRMIKGVGNEYGQSAKGLENLILNCRDEFLAHFDCAFYYKHLKPYFGGFPDERIHVILFEDLVKDSADIVKGIYEFLGVDATFEPSLGVRNSGGIYKSKFINEIININRFVLKCKYTIKRIFPKFVSKPTESIFRMIDKINIEKAPLLHPNVREKLITIYREDIKSLQDLINRNLHQWLNL